MVIVFESGQKVDVSAALPKDKNGELVSPSLHLRDALGKVAPEMLKEFDRQMAIKKRRLENIEKHIKR